jgi:hypothetical protein
MKIGKRVNEGQKLNTEDRRKLLQGIIETLLGKIIQEEVHTLSYGQ